MQSSTNILKLMEVVGSDGGHVGVVDQIEGQTIRLARCDPNAGGVHHWIPLNWVDLVDNVVHLNRREDDATRQWQSAASAAAKS
jgi:hypothetical protein